VIVVRTILFVVHHVSESVGYSIWDQLVGHEKMCLFIVMSLDLKELC